MSNQYKSFISTSAKFNEVYIINIITIIDGGVKNTEIGIDKPDKNKGIPIDIWNEMVEWVNNRPEFHK